jgi:hypothetical protein
MSGLHEPAPVIEAPLRMIKRAAGEIKEMK